MMHIFQGVCKIYKLKKQCEILKVVRRYVLPLLIRAQMFAWGDSQGSIHHENLPMKY